MFVYIYICVCVCACVYVISNFYCFRLHPQLGSLPGSAKRQLARCTGLHPDRISRWVRGAN